MLLAIEAEKSDSTSISRAAKLHEVPRQTLKEQSTTWCTPRPQAVTKENDLAGFFLVDTSKMVYGKSRQQVKAITVCRIRDKGLLDRDKVPSNGWYYNFKRKQSMLALYKGECLNGLFQNDENIKEYFDMLLENHLMEKPAQIYNV